MVNVITSAAQFEGLLSDKKLVVAKFSAVWCGPCKMIEQPYHSLATKYPNVHFCHIDGDQNRDLVGRYRIGAYPTFKFFKGGQEIGEIRGANIQGVEQFVQQHQTPAFDAFNGSGKTLGGSSTTSYNPWADERKKDIERRRKKKEEEEKERKKKEEEEEASRMKDDDDEDEDDEELKKAMELSLKEEEGDDMTDDNNDEEEKKGDEPQMSDEEKLALIEKSVKPDLLQMMLDMGFPKIRALKSLIETGSASIEAATEWLDQHQNDEDIDKMIEFTIETDEQKRERIEKQKQKVKDMIEMKKKLRAKEEKKKEREREKKRRELGRKAHEANRNWADTKRQLEKEKEKAEKKRVKEEKKRMKKLLKIDKLQRHIEQAERRGDEEALFKYKSDLAKLTGGSAPKEPVKATTTTNTQKKKGTTGDSVIRIRMLDGSQITASFKPTDSLQTVHQHAQSLQRTTSFRLMTTFPRKVYNESDLQKTLSSLGLGRGGQLICTTGY